jgi:hypothetical protein
MSARFGNVQWDEESDVEDNEENENCPPPLLHKRLDLLPEGAAWCTNAVSGLDMALLAINLLGGRHRCLICEVQANVMFKLRRRVVDCNATTPFPYCMAASKSNDC